MSAKRMTRTGAVVRMLIYTSALPIGFAVFSVIYSLMVGANG